MRPAFARTARLAAVLLLVAHVGAQQPNTFNASLVINGSAGPPYPIVGVPAPRGLPNSIAIGSSAPNAPFVLFGAPSLNATGWSVLGGELLDVNIGVGGFVVLDGIANPAAFNTGPTSLFAGSGVVPISTPIGTQAAFQALVADAGAPFGSRLTAATRVDVTAGLTIVPINTPNNGGQLFEFVSYGMTFPYYGNVYTRMFVNTDGNVTFGSSSGDFTPTPNEFRQNQPRIAPMWTDLTLGYPGAAITVTVDQTTVNGFPSVTVDWIQMAEWQNTGARHTFQLVMNMLTGDITINHDPFNVAMIYDQLMGISPGQNILMPNGQWAASTDLSTLPGTPVTGMPMQAFWEWYGLIGMPFYTQGFNNPWDMTGSTTRFLAIGAGAPGAFYFGT